MKIGLISDIHGHYIALSKCLEELREEKVDELFCLGDMIEGGEQDQEVVTHLMNSNIQCLKGNHDIGEKDHLNKESNQWLNALPQQLEAHELKMAHASLYPNKGFLVNKSQKWFTFEDWTTTFCAVGHVHRPKIFDYSLATQETKELELNNSKLEIEPNHRYMMIVPSLAYNKGPNTKPGYAILDDHKQTIEYRFLDIEPIK